MTNAQLLEKLVELNKLFDCLYNTRTEGGNRLVIGVSDNYVQLNAKALVELFLGASVTIRKGLSETYPYELRLTYKGVEFLALCTKEEVENLF